MSREKAIAAWLFAVAALIVLMIILGGVTRLTHAGLSMVDWRPLTGWLPPLGEAEWEGVFARYRAYPEYRKFNLGMTLQEFKSIFWFEYAHRLLGRTIGVAFLAPFVVFAAKGWVGRKLAPTLIALFILGGLQGVLGWYMVKSGLVERPDVSQYRLAAHLVLALAILGSILWVAIGLARPKARPGPNGEAAIALTKWAWGLLGLIFVTALSGAFVAGLDAGLVFNTFPLMGGVLVPEGLLDLSPGYLNFFENVVTVQFDHRVLAISVLAAVGVFWWRARKSVLTPGQRLATNLLTAVALAQVVLGISTLLLAVPVPLAALHQAGAVALFCIAVWMVREFRTPAATGANRP